MDSKTQKFATAILNRRKELRLSQEQVAEKVGTTKQMISKYERCQRSPKIQMANAIANALDTTIDILLDEPQISTDDDILEILHQNPKLCLLFDRQKKMSDEDIDFMLKMAERITKENYSD